MARPGSTGFAIEAHRRLKNKSKLEAQKQKEAYERQVKEAELKREIERQKHGWCWETFFIFAYCGLVVEIPSELLKFKLLLPFQRQPRKQEKREQDAAEGRGREGWRNRICSRFFFWG